jgi:hypothetical protein
MLGSSAGGLRHWAKAFTVVARACSGRRRSSGMHDQLCHIAMAVTHSGADRRRTGSLTGAMRWPAALQRGMKVGCGGNDGKLGDNGNFVSGSGAPRTFDGGAAAVGPAMAARVPLRDSSGATGKARRAQTKGRCGGSFILAELWRWPQHSSGGCNAGADSALKDAVAVELGFDMGLGGGSGSAGIK